MLKLTQENKIIDLPDLNGFQIGDEVIVDANVDYDRFEGVIIGIELRRLHGSSYLVPSITILHDGCITDEFKPIDCRKVDPQPPAPKPLVSAPANPSGREALENAKAETLWAVRRFHRTMTPEELVQTIYEGPMLQKSLAAEAQISALQARIQGLEEALKPFAVFCEQAEGFVQARAEQGGSAILPTKHFSLADFRRARAALNKDEKHG